MSQDNYAVGFAPEWLHRTNMDSNYYTDGGNRTAGIILAIIPATIALGLGIFVLIRRRKAR